MRLKTIIAAASALLLLTVPLFMWPRGDEVPPKQPNFVRLTGRWDCVEVLDGEYRVCNNIWGSGAGVGEQVLDVDPAGTYFKVVKTTHRSNNVAAYPFIYKGCHWGHCTRNSPLPIKVRDLRSSKSSWRIDVRDVDGTWNAAYDIWFSPRGASSPEGGAELMIWVNRGGGAMPAGRKVSTVEIAGLTWDVYYANLSWNYVAFASRVALESVELDLKAFIDEAVRMGYIDPEWYLDAVEAGFEIWSGGKSLTTLSFTVAVEKD